MDAQGMGIRTLLFQLARRFSHSVIRFGKKIHFGQIVCLWQFSEGLFTIRRNLKPTLATTLCDRANF